MGFTSNRNRKFLMRRRITGPSRFVRPLVGLADNYRRFERKVADGLGVKVVRGKRSSGVPPEFLGAVGRIA